MHVAEMGVITKEVAGTLSATLESYYKKNDKKSLVEAIALNYGNSFKMNDT